MPRFFTVDPQMAHAMLLPPLSARTWSGDRRPVSIPGIDCTGYSWIVWIDEGSGELRGATITSPCDVSDRTLAFRFLRSLIRAIMMPFSQGAAVRPRSLQFRRKQDVPDLRPCLTELELQLKPWKASRSLEETFAWLNDYLATGPGHSYLDRPGVDAAAVGAFFSDAATLRERFSVAAEVEGGIFAMRGFPDGDRFVRLFGGPPEVEIYSSAAEVEAAALGTLERSPAIRALRLHFDDFHHLGPTFMRDIVRHRWLMVDSDEIPLLGRDGTTMEEVMPTNEDFRFVCSILRMIVGRVFEGQSEFTTPDGATVRVEWPYARMGRG